MKHVVALSGGKDSTAMALRLKELHDYDFEYVCTPTGDELPEMKQHFVFLEKLLYAKLKRLPNKSLCELIHSWQMIPNHRARFCTRVIKIEPFINYMESLPADSIMYVGLRADETGRLGLVQPGAKFKTVCPLQEWNWREEDVKKYLKRLGIKIPRRTDCARCFWNTLNEWYQLYQNHFPIYWDALIQERLIGHTFRSPQRDTWGTSLLDLANDFNMRGEPKKRKIKQSNDKCRFCSM